MKILFVFPIGGTIAADDDVEEEFYVKTFEQTFKYTQNDYRATALGGGEAKFGVVIGEGGDLYFTLISLRHAEGLTHERIAKDLLRFVPGTRFVGAGFCSQRGAGFGSESCFQRFGYDRPSDKDLQEKILEGISAFINKTP